jgi:small subunit ribosomal protein S9
MEVINSIGRRKASTARVYLSQGTGTIIVNGKEGNEYFPLVIQQFKLAQPFKLTSTEGQFDVNANVEGGGISGQVDAVRLGIARALVKHNAELKPALKKEGLMTRDPRTVERKKFGKKKARKSFQFSKR